MNDTKIFMNRRSGRDRRQDFDPCKDMLLDIFHRKRRKSIDRRGNKNRSLQEDYYAFMQTQEHGEA